MTDLLTQFAIGASILASVLIVVNIGGKRHGKHPPGPKGWPIIGNIFDLVGTGNLVPIFTKWAKQYGSIVQFAILNKTHVILSDDDMVQELFVKRGAKYSGRNSPHAISYLMRDLNPAMMPKNDIHRRERKLIHSAVSISVNQKYQALMHHEAVLVLRDILNTPDEFFKHFQRYSYGIIGRCFFGKRIYSAEDPFIVDNEDFINTTMECFDPSKYPANIFPFLTYLPKFLVPSLVRLDGLRDRSDDKILNLRRDYASPSNNNSSIFADFLNNREKYDISDQEAGAAFYSLIGGGTLSTTNALLSFMYLMMAYPEWQDKLHAHIEQVVGADRVPQSTDIPQLPLVRAIVKEMIRYRSIVAELGIPHQLDEDDEVAGYHFKKGTTFHANYAAILLSPATYPDTDPRTALFNPSRYLDPSYPTYKAPLTIYPNCQGFTPFGYGRRACPGYDFAERSLVMLVALMGWACEIKRPRNENGEEYLPEVKYESGPNPRPQKFGVGIVSRSGRMEVLEEFIRAAEEG